MQFKNSINLGFLVLSGLTCVNSTYGNPPKKPNILFILTDDLGKEWVSSYGAGKSIPVQGQGSSGQRI